MMPSDMKHMLAVPNIKSDRKQLETLIPSPEAVVTFSALAKKLGTSREAIGREIGSKGEILIWAFQQGKTARAEQLRRAALGVIDRLITEQVPA
jgi:hypothetical protein